MSGLCNGVRGGMRGPALEEADTLSAAGEGQYHAVHTLRSSLQAQGRKASRMQAARMTGV